MITPEKLKFYMSLQESICREIVITGSTALEMYGMVHYSSYQDLDLIIYEEDFNDIVKARIENLHMIAGVNKVYEDDERAVGKLYSMEFVVDKIGTIVAEKIIMSVHLFAMKSPERPQTSMKVNGHWCYLASPMNIIEAKKYIDRAKDWRDLARMCSVIMKPMPIKSKNGSDLMQDTINMSKASK